MGNGKLTFTQGGSRGVIGENSGSSQPEGIFEQIIMKSLAEDAGGGGDWGTEQIPVCDSNSL